MEGTDKSESLMESSSEQNNSPVESKSESNSPMESKSKRSSPVDSDRDNLTNKKKKKKKKSRISREYKQQNKRRQKQKKLYNLEKNKNVTPENMYDNGNIGILSLYEQRRRTKQGAIDICMNHFGCYTDPRYIIKENIRHLICTNDPLNLPGKLRNLKIHNLCTDPKALSTEILDTLGENLGHGVGMPIKKTNPIDFN